jgi:tetratricopeptide (TPR) repeat protein
MRIRPGRMRGRAWRQFGKIITAGHSRPPVPDWKDFDRVYSLLSVAVAEVEQGQAPAHAAALRQNLAVALTAVGRQEDAVAEYARAFALDPNNIDIAYRYAMALGKGGRPDHAIGTLRTWLETRQAPEITLLLAQFLGTRLTGETRRPEDLKEPIEILEAGRANLASLNEDLRADWIAVLIQFHVDAHDAQTARRVLDETPTDWLERPVRHLLLADIEEAAGHRADAKKAAIEAADSLVQSTHPTSVRQIALLLEELAEFDRAAQTWRRLATMHTLGIDEQHMLACLQKSKNREALIAACRELRTNGLYNDRVIDVELAALERVSFERLSQTLQELLDATIPEKLKKELRAQLAYVSIFTDKPDLIEKDAARLPRVNEVETARYGRMVTEVIRRGPEPFAAVQYAYELFRRFPDEPDSHLAMLFAVGLPQREVAAWPEPTVVIAGTAVRYRENDTSQDVWCIIEDLPLPKPVLLERSPSDPIARAMDGKIVGDAFLLRAGPLPRREGTILEIVSKYTYRIRDCLANFETRFPDHQQVVWQIHAGEDGKAGIDEILRHVDAQAERQKEIDDAFRNQNVPLFVYGEATGQSVFEAVHRVASAPELKIRATFGAIDEQLAAQAAMKSATTYVLDPTAVGILYILHSARIAKIENLLDAIDGELVLSEHTLGDARAALASLKMRGDFSIAKLGDQYVRHMVSAEEVQREHDRLRDFVAFLRTRCSIAAAEHPSATDAPWYGELLETIGPAGTESVRLVATRPNAVLWTDEVFTAHLARPRIGSRRVWTKQLIDSLSQGRRLPAGTSAAASILLYRIGYYFTGLSPDGLLLAAKQGGWKAINEPLRTLLKQYAEPNITPESAIGSSTGFLVGVWTHQSTRKHHDGARAITCRIVREILKRPDGTTLVWYIRRAVSGVIDRSDRTLGKRWRKAIRYCLTHHRHG